VLLLRLVAITDFFYYLFILIMIDVQ